MQDTNIRKTLSELTTHKLVAAPAGSGKTTESIKYFLNCLLHSLEPENVLSITFTNKATAELRQRLVNELKRAKSNQVPNSPHEMQMFELAKKVLKRSEERGWGILENPNRLEIKTFDSLCKSIAAMAPASSSFGKITMISERPNDLYRAAAESLLGQYKENSDLGEDIRKLLMHFDNKFPKAVNMLAEMLSYREQWLPLVMNRDVVEQREVMENNNAQVIAKCAAPLFDTLNSVMDELKDIVAYAKGTECNVHQLDSHALTDEQTFKFLTSFKDVFFTKQGKVKSKLTKREGFGPLKDIKDEDAKAHATMMREQASCLLEHFRDLDEDIVGILDSVVPPNYSNKEWDLLSSILTLLPILAAKLLLQFNKHKECDFAEIQNAALRALGEDGKPSDTMLRLDNRISHILVDEVQDCSPFQFELLKRLSSGWQKDDGKTLYLVGDKMQSIYLFRGADVGNFIQASDNGVGHLNLETHQLTSNYRSQAGIIEWVNSKFSSAFGSKTDASLGSTTYNPSEAAKPALDNEAVSITRYEGPNWLARQASDIVNQIHKIQSAEKNASIAVLGRSRADLATIIEHLRKGEVGHRAIDIHPLASLSVITDLTLLTKSICDLSDKVSWIGLLRSPLMGLSLTELEIIAQEGGTKRARYKDIMIAKLKSEKTLSKLSQGTVERIKRLTKVIDQSIRHAERKSLASIIEGAFMVLGGLSVLKDANEKNAYKAFLELLGKFSFEQFDGDKLSDSIETLFAPDEKSSGMINLMTMHKSKGLEFDYVFIPNSHKPIRPEVTKLVDFVQTSIKGERIAVFAPNKSSSLTETRMNKCIQAIKSMKARNEAIRLAYVGSTRAKKQLFILGESKAAYPESSLLGMLKVNDSEAVKVLTSEVTEQEVDTLPKRARLTKLNNLHLPEGQMLASSRGIIHVDNEAPPKFDWMVDTHRIIGIVFHSTIEKIADKGWDVFFAQPAETNRAYWRVLLLKHGIADSSLFYAIRELEEQLQYLKSSDYMAWALQQSNIEVEKPVYTKRLGKLKKLIIDMTFETDNARYIIDTKTGRPSHGETEQAFAHRMMARYAEKMESYKNLFPDNETIKVCLYLSSIGKIATYDFKEDVAV
ncbi:MAG: UvrD-helicase domain-containing protein [Alteromonas stellipolaris]|uniref:UvrD-helicase domain-containing protein n=1 Tax=Alteromonas stellipolaris TaxID=233316 RepID=UPI003B8B6167